MSVKQLLIVILLLPNVLFAQIDLRKMDRYIEEARKTYNVPGMAVAVVKDGQIVLNKGYGVLQESKKAKVDEKTLFAIASNTKAFVSSALATLVQEGKLNWDDKVNKYLPYFELYDPYVTSEVTVRDLLCHRVGLGTFSGDAIWYRSELPAEEIVRLAKNVPQAFSFRAGYGYSNLMFITAGEVIKSVTGKPWDQYVKETFFEPLKMDRTITSTSSLKDFNNIASPHKTALDKNTAIDWVNWDNMGAAGGIISSVNDMAKWMNLQLSNGILQGDTLLDPAQQNILWTPHNNYTMSERGKKVIPGRHFTGYGLGFGLQDYFGRMMVSHGGGYDGMYSRVVMVPDENLGIVILTNSMSGISGALSYYIVNSFIKEDTRDFVKVLYKPQTLDQRVTDLKTVKLENTKPTLKTDQYIGTYNADMYGDIIVKNEDGKLRLYFSHSPKLSATLEHWHNDTWQIIWDETHAWFDFGLTTFTLNDNLNVTGLKFNVPNYDIFFHEFEVLKK